MAAHKMVAFALSALLFLVGLGSASAQTSINVTTSIAETSTSTAGKNTSTAAPTKSTEAPTTSTNSSSGRRRRSNLATTTSAAATTSSSVTPDEVCMTDLMAMSVACHLPMGNSSGDNQSQSPMMNRSDIIGYMCDNATCKAALATAGKSCSGTQEGDSLQNMTVWCSPCARAWLAAGEVCGNFGPEIEKYVMSTGNRLPPVPNSTQLQPLCANMNCKAQGEILKSTCTSEDVVPETSNVLGVVSRMYTLYGMCPEIGNDDGDNCSIAIRDMILTCNISSDHRGDATQYYCDNPSCNSKLIMAMKTCSGDGRGEDLQRQLGWCTPCARAFSSGGQACGNFSKEVESYIMPPPNHNGSHSAPAMPSLAQLQTFCAATQCKAVVDDIKKVCSPEDIVPGTPDIQGVLARVTELFDMCSGAETVQCNSAMKDMSLTCNVSNDQQVDYTKMYCDNAPCNSKLTAAVEACNGTRSGTQLVTIAGLCTPCGKAWSAGGQACGNFSKEVNNYIMPSPNSNIAPAVPTAAQLVSLCASTQCKAAVAGVQSSCTAADVLPGQPIFSRWSRESPVSSACAQAT
ncbi:unnamed protein product [Polarella glacialis]|uniref:Uncharacterized protein n=1 Tax=Polarella glacialis TaxID=89957 RepID=A0A813LFY1_POLGL|nr:unnamed protein product [Polarella glacialis]